ncbi:hypothetical protein V6Z05_10585 [Leptospira venezuelensis]|uniref:hypothetical protein n=1 Tax=Leptospira venezuelensis TaxID=1958811 RepID=UPI001F2BD866|nr:hypothetical protein [Leptospira venezuelensis]
MSSIKIRWEDSWVEMAWFCYLCNGDYEYLGVPDPKLRYSFEHCAEIIQLVDELGYQNILLPSSYQTNGSPLLYFVEFQKTQDGYAQNTAMFF